MGSPAEVNMYLLLYMLQVHSVTLYVYLLQTSKFTSDPGAIQKAADFVKAFMLGFAVEVMVCIYA